MGLNMDTLEARILPPVFLSMVNSAAPTFRFMPRSYSHSPRLYSVRTRYLLFPGEVIEVLRADHTVSVVRIDSDATTLSRRQVGERNYWFSDDVKPEDDVISLVESTQLIHDSARKVSCWVPAAGDIFYRCGTANRVRIVLLSGEDVYWSAVDRAHGDRSRRSRGRCTLSHFLNVHCL